MNGLQSSAQTGATLFSIEQGLQRGGTMGNLQAGIGAAGLANKAGAFGGAGGQVGAGLGVLGGGLGVINGIRQGGVLGYGGAAVGGLRAAAGVESLMGNAGIAGNLGMAAGYLAAPLAVYSAIKNWKSGDTANDTIQGAEAGAAIGSVVPVIGTAIGAAIGGVVGAASSAFGGGKVSQEATAAQGYTAAYDKMNPQQQQQFAMQQSPANNVQYLQGLMNGNSSAAGHSSNLQVAFGKNNVAGFTSQMTQTVNAALKGGKLPPNATPEQIYQQVVQPWLNSKSGGATSGNDIKGNSVSSAEAAAITAMIGQWQSGQLSSTTPVGVKGQTINIPQYGG